MNAAVVQGSVGHSSRVAAAGWACCLPACPPWLACRPAHSLPRPRRVAVNPNVEIKDVPARTLVAMSWHGNSPREAEVERRTAQLREVMRQAGLAPKQGGKTHVWQYGGRGRGTRVNRVKRRGFALWEGGAQSGGRSPVPAQEPRRHHPPPAPPLADPPFQWGMFRTNEVLIEVDSDAAQS